MSDPSPHNFSFLSRYDTDAGRLANQAEGYVHSDPESCLFKLRLMIEMMARRLTQMQLPDLVSPDLSTMLRALERAGSLPRERADAMHAIRRDGNAAVHGNPFPAPAAMRRLRDAHRVSSWYCSMVQRGAKVRSAPFVPPAMPTPKDTAQRKSIEAAEKLEDRIEERRHQTRQALLLFGEGFDVGQDTRRIIAELEALDKVAHEAGEPLIDADSTMMVMAMELESLLHHPRLGLTSSEAKRMAAEELGAVKAALEAREQGYEDARAALAREASIEPADETP